MHAQNRALWRVDNRRRQHRAEHATVGDGKRSTGEFFDGEFAVLRAFAEIGNDFFDARETQLIGIAHNRHHQTARTAHRHANIVVAVVHDVIAVDRGIDQRVFFQRIHRGLDEERHEAELHTVLFFKLVFVTVAQVDHRLHVHFVERS